MDLILHIGSEKTGTTALQTWLSRHATTLRKHGVFYSRALGRPNNRRICLYGLDLGVRDDGLEEEGIADEAGQEALRERIAREFNGEADEAEESGAELFVISNEHCQSRLRTVEAIARVRDLLAPRFDSMRVICMVRPQIDLCLSLASTMTRNGSAMSRQWVEQQMRPNNLYYDFDKMLGRWASVFGKHNVEPVAFKRHADTIKYFATLLGVAHVDLPVTKGTNAAVDYRTMALVNALRAATPDQRGFTESEWLYINQLPVLERLALDRASAEDLQANFDDSNARLCAAWSEILPEDMAPDFARFPKEGNIDRLDCALEIGPILHSAIERLHASTHYERARYFALASERDATRGHMELSISNCEEGIAEARKAMAVTHFRKTMEGLVTNLEKRRALMRERLKAKQEAVRGAGAVLEAE